jgi:hypothetical protein
MSGKAVAAMPASAIMASTSALWRSVRTSRARLPGSSVRFLMSSGRQQIAICELMTPNRQ